MKKTQKILLIAGGLAICTVLAASLFLSQKPQHVSVSGVSPDARDGSKLYNEFRLLDRKTFVGGADGTVEVESPLPIETEFDAEIGPDPKTQASRELTLLDSVTFAWYKDQPREVEISPELLENEEERAKIDYTMTLNYYSAGLTDGGAPYYAVEMMVESPREKAAKIKRYLIRTQPAANNDQLYFGPEGNDPVDASRIENIRYFSYPNQVPENLDVELKANFTTSGFFPFSSDKGHRVTVVLHP